MYQTKTAESRPSGETAESEVGMIPEMTAGQRRAARQILHAIAEDIAAHGEAITDQTPAEAGAVNSGSDEDATPKS